jgi:hypothetical protein
LRLLVVLALGCAACGPGHPELSDLVHIVSSSPARIIATVTQQTDHDNPSRGTFEQRIVIYPATPTVVVDVEGYELGDGFGAHEVAAILGATEVQIEHRFFGDSLPDDWSLLTTAQSAADVHHVIATLREFYSGRWLSSGISKGGVEALYHRARYPRDVDGTVAYVAPASMSLRDERYATWVASLGSEGCRHAMVAFERMALAEPRRSGLVSALTKYLAGHTLTVLGADRILELSVRETPFTFWQYGDASRCSAIPDTIASDTDVLTFLDSTNHLVGWADDGLAADQGYWYAAATELGYPADDYAAVVDEARYVSVPTPLQTVTVAPPPPFDPGPLSALTNWIAGAADRVILVYGEHDGWTAGAFTELAPGVEKHVVAGGYHLSRLKSLPQYELDAVVETMSSWVSD